MERYSRAWLVRLMSLLTVVAFVLFGISVMPTRTSHNLRLTADSLFNVGGTRSPFGPEFLSFAGVTSHSSTPPIEVQLGGVAAQSDVVRNNIVYPASIWPVTGIDTPTLDRSVAVGVSALNDAILTTPGQKELDGASQGAVVITVWLNKYASSPSAPPADQLSIVLIGNPSRPNGGLLERFVGLHIPIVGITAVGATPQTQYKVVDVAREYDGFADFPAYPLNILSVLNALMGTIYIHPNYNDINVNDPANRVDVVGNTTYITVPTKHLPLLQPLRDLAAALGLKHTPFLDAIEPILRVLVDAGYTNNDPMSNPGTPTPAKLGIPLSNLVTAANQLPVALQQGLSSLGVNVPTVTPATTSLNLKSVVTASHSGAAFRKPRLPSLSDLTNKSGNNFTPVAHVATGRRLDDGWKPGDGLKRAAKAINSLTHADTHATSGASRKSSSSTGGSGN